MQASARFTVVTAASALYRRSLWQLLRSAERRRLPAAHQFVAWDLGLTPPQREMISGDFPWCLWRTLDFAALPPHVPPAACTYAWKPLVIEATVREFGGRVLWLDSATVLHASLDAVGAAVDSHGLYTLAGQSPILARCDLEIWQAISGPLEILDQPERAAGVIGLDTTHRVARALIGTWAGLAMDARYWRPLSARHRPEQALLSILIYEAVRRGELTLNPGAIDISCPEPVRWLSTRNKVPPGMPRWLDPVVRLHYAAVKCADRLLLRLAHWKRTWVDGWHRWPKEHFRVFIGDASGGGLHALSAPAGSYYADPFLWQHAGSDWLFVEEFRYGANAGRLVALPLADGRPAGPAQPLELPPGHKSFPFLFEHEGRLFLLPESTHNRTADLYRCEEFPRRWQLHRRLLVDVDAADSVLLAHAGRWWLFTAVRDEQSADGRHLAIFHRPDLLAGTWQAHPVNAERRPADPPAGRSRCAGAIVRTAGGELLRPVHTSRRYYGQSAQLMRIERLTPAEFQETEWTGRLPGADWLAQVAPHHVSWLGNRCAFDVRDRVSYLQHLPLIGRRFGPDERAVRFLAANGR